LPKARVRPKSWRFPVVWIVPVVAAILAGYLVYGRLQEYGPTITIKFKDGGGVKAGRTEVHFRGVPIGEVRRVDLGENQQYVVVHARLRQSASSVAKEGSKSWIVRPEVGLENVSGLSTIITGPYIQVLPGAGKPTTEFVGLERPPPAPERGLRIIVAAVNLGSIRPGAPVYYRGIEVGTVTDTDLSSDATLAHINVIIRQRYARLVRVGSRFWAVGGVDVNAGLFKGVEINIQSLRALLTGGIAFATPEDSKRPAVKDGTLFILHDKPQKEWLDWSPRIPIPRGN
jgi:paraquat-inducible protein B